MPATPLLDGRPGGLDAYFRPGSPFTVNLTFPADYLDARVFTASLEGVELDVNIVGDVLSISMTAAQTLAVVNPREMTLTEVVAGDDIATIVGTWAPSPKAAQQVGTSVNVTAGTTTASVTVVAPEVATRELDYTPDASDRVIAVANAFTIYPVTGTTVSVPQSGRPIYLRGSAWCRHSVANSTVALMIGPTGQSTLGGQIASAAGTVGPTNANPTLHSAETITPEVRITPGTPAGDYQLYVWSSTNGNVTLVGTLTPNLLYALEV